MNSGKRKISTLGPDWFAVALVLSTLLHAFALAFLARRGQRGATRFVVRPLLFARKDAVEPAWRPAAFPQAARPEVENPTSSDCPSPNETAQVKVTAPTGNEPRRVGAFEEKLRLADKIRRRPGAAVDRPSNFLDLLRKRISKSCEKHVSNRLRIAGLERVVVLSVTVLPSGNLESVEVIQSCNLAAVDAASVEAVKLAAPFPRFPRALKLPRLKVRVPITYAMLGGQ